MLTFMQLHLATMLGFYALVDFLVERDIELNSCDKNGYTALHMAALRGRVAVSRLLLQAGADVECRTFAGDTAFDIARGRDQLDVADLYPQKRSSPNPSRRHSDSHSSTPRLDNAQFSLRSPRRRKLFSLSPHESDEETESEWTSEEEACFASESDVDVHLSRVSSAVSFKSPARSRAQSAIDARALLASSALEIPSFSRTIDEPRAGLGTRLFSRILGRSGSTTGSTAALDFLSAQSLSLSSVTGSSQDQHIDSEPEDAVAWPESALFGHSKRTTSVDSVKGMRASLSRRLGYPLEHLAEDAMRSYTFHANKYGRLGKDKM